MSVMRIRHTGIVVSEMGRSLRFYRDLLGLEVWADFEDASEYVSLVTGVVGARLRMVKLKAVDGVSIELLQYLSHARPVPARSNAFDVGVNHVALQVADIDTLYQRLRADGVEFHTPPRVSSDRTAKVTYCRDPEGVIVELVEIALDGGFAGERNQ